MSSDTYIDYTPFASPHFNVNAYANAILADEPYNPDAPAGHADAGETQKSASAAAKGKARETLGGGAGAGASLTPKGDIGLALAKLNYGIEDATKQLRQEIASHHPLMLAHLSTSTDLLTSVQSIRSTLSSLDASLNRLHGKIHAPHAELERLVRRLDKARQAGELARRASRFLVLARRLEGQMRSVQGRQTNGADKAANGQVILDEDGVEGEREREMAKAALSIAELDALLAAPQNSGEDGGSSSHTPLQSLSIVKAHAPAIAKAKEAVIQEMETMVVQGLADLNQALLSTSLQTAYNLRLLPQLVSNLLADLNDAVEARIARVFDVTSIGKEVVAQEQQSSTGTSLLYRSRQRTAETAPNNSNHAIWTSVLWRRLEILMDDIANCCIKVYTLEKVLRMKKDPATQGDFLTEVMKLLDEKPSFTFWTTLATGFDTQSREACMASPFLQSTLGAGYPRLLRLVHEFFAKIAVHTETVYTQEHQSPESVLVLRSISKLEALYLTRSSGRISEAIGVTFTGGPRQPPGPSEGISVARTVLNELDAARFDPLLVKAVARGAANSLDGYTKRIEAMIVKDFSATSLIGPLASAGQITNAALVSCLYHLATSLEGAAADFPASASDVLKAPIATATLCYKRVTDSLNTAILRELSSIINRIHKVDFSKPVDPMSMGGSGSPYIKDLAEKLTFLRTEILGRMSLGEMGKEWVLDITRHIMHTFLLHATIARPLGESGKLKLTSDMTELEFALGSFLATGSAQGARSTMRLERVGDEYKALRAFRTMLFLDLQSLADRSQTYDLQPLLVLHHIIVLSPLQLPHQVHNWTEAEYVLWVDKHTEAESWKLLEKAVAGQRDGQGGLEWRDLIKRVLEQARAGAA